MKHIVPIFLFFTAGLAFAQTTYEQEIKTFQKELNAEFLDPDQSPLTAAERAKFKGHNYFPINQNYKVTATFIKSNDPITFQMKTTSSRKATFAKFGTVQFNLNGKPYQLAVYQSPSLTETEEYKDYLFLPFTDLTNGNESYGGGRYIDLSISEGSEMIIDFNKAYSPSCAYNHNYSCPIPPAENDLHISIEAGVKNLDL